MLGKRLASMFIPLVLAAPFPALAASNGKPAFDKADSDGNGEITVSEAVDAGVPKAEAKREDINDDGKLSQSDWKFIDMDPIGGGGSSSS